MSYGIRTVVGGPNVPQGDAYIPFAIARTAREIAQIRRVLHAELLCVSRAIVNAVEVGCGYGRLTPVLLEFAKHRVLGLERDSELLGCVDSYNARMIDFRKIEKLSELPLPDHTTDLLMSYTVLQHVAPEEIDPVLLEIKRLMDTRGYVLLCEDDSTQVGPDTWGRTPGWYADRLGATIVRSEKRTTGNGTLTLLRMG